MVFEDLPRGKRHPGLGHIGVVARGISRTIGAPPRSTETSPSLPPVRSRVMVAFDFLVFRYDIAGGIKGNDAG